MSTHILYIHVHIYAHIYIHTYMYTFSLSFTQRERETVCDRVWPELRFSVLLQCAAFGLLGLAAWAASVVCE